MNLVSCGLVAMTQALAFLHPYCCVLLDTAFPRQFLNLFHLFPFLYNMVIKCFQWKDYKVKRNGLTKTGSKGWSKFCFFKLKLFWGDFCVNLGICYTSSLSLISSSIMNWHVCLNFIEMKTMGNDRIPRPLPHTLDRGPANCGRVWLTACCK